MKLQKALIRICAALLVGTSLVVTANDAPLLHTTSEIKEVSKGDLRIKIERQRTLQGQICISLFSTAMGFPAEGRNANASLCLPASDSNQLGGISLSQIPYGNYAIAIFHDENLDKNLNLGFFGIPTEGFGFSNNPGLRIGAPSFQESSFNFSEDGQDVVIDLRYLF